MFSTFLTASTILMPAILSYPPYVQFYKTPFLLFCCEASVVRSRAQLSEI